MSEHMPDITRPIDHDKYVVAGLNGDGSCYITWPTNAGPVQIIDHFSSILGPQTMQGEGLVRLQPSESRQEPVTSELSVDTDGNIVHVTSFAMKVGDGPHVLTPDDTESESYEPVVKGGIGKGAAIDVIDTVRDYPERTGMFYIDNPKLFYGWWEPNTMKTSFSVAMTAVRLAGPSRETINELFRTTAVGGLAVYHATLDELAEIMPVLRTA